MRSLGRLLTFSFFLVSCQAPAQAPQEAPTRTRTEEPQALPKQRPTDSGGAKGSFVSLPQASSLVAIGDLHGDLEQTRKVLRLAGAIDESDHWRGGKLVVVQTGDEIDRGDDDRAVLDLMERLKGEANAAGGAVIAMSGNHELMNVVQDFRYVTPGSVAAFDSAGGRLEAFRPGGPYARMLADRPVVVQVGDTVFAHGGVLMKHVRYGLKRMNDEVRAFLLGQRPDLSPVVMAEDGPVWTRVYSGVPTPACEELGQVLGALGAKRMVVGHTVQPEGVNAACDGRVWRIDVGLSRHYGGPVQALRIEKGEAKRLSDAN
ncbi:MAG: shewanella-like protein phosphatase [Myxococcales bacterium]